MRLTVSGLLLVALINTAGGQEDKTMSDNAKITIEEARLKLARALAINGNPDEARKYYKLAEQAGQALKDPEDMKIFMGNLRSEPWGGLR